MINEESIAAVAAQQWGDHFVAPIYHDYGFAQIPQTLRALLADSPGKGVPFGPGDGLYDRYDAVILFFIDAFGWRFFQRYADRHPFLRRFVEAGLVNKLTSQFPSTTAAHVTAIHTGLPVGISGIYEWFYYEPRLDAIIAPLLFSYAGDHDRDTLTRSGANPADLFPTHTLYQELAEAGVRSYVFQSQIYAASPYTRSVTMGAKVSPFATLPDAITSLGELMAAQRERSYYFLYYDRIDSICHLHGPDSPELDQEIVTFLDIMEQRLQPLLRRPGQRVLFLMTADHGQTAISPRNTIYLNHSLPAIHNWSRTNRAGKLLVPAGAQRDMFLYIKDEYLDEATVALREHLQGKAEVHCVEDLVARGFFGTVHPSDAFVRRVGNLVILPYSGEAVWWHEPGRFEQRFYGSHGGLTRDEMETLLLVQPSG